MDADQQRKQLLKNLHHLQRKGHLCDLTMVTSSGRAFVAHSAVVAAASSLLKQEMEGCERGRYTINTSFSAEEIKAFIHYAYTGDKTSPLLSGFPEMGLLCDRYDNRSVAEVIISLLLQFANEGLFCNTVYYGRPGNIKSAHCYLLAARYPVLSPLIANKSRLILHLDKSLYSRLSDTIISNTYCVNLKRRKGKTQTSRKPNVQITNFYYKSCEISSDESTNEKSSSTQQKRGCYICDICGEELTEKRKFELHRMMHAKDKSFVCNMCDKKFSRRIYMERHRLVHAIEKPFVCQTCNKTFTMKSSLRQHELIHSDQPHHVCKTCNKAFKLKPYLRMHELIHTDYKPHLCESCGKGFRVKAELRRHEQMHSTTKPYVCDRCGNAFRRKEHLGVHQLCHSNEKPYSCETCDKRFNCRSQLRRHKRVHTNIKPYTCEVCHKTFSQKGNLNTHQLVHTNEKRHVCNICGMRFTYKQTLTKHLLNH